MTFYQLLSEYYNELFPVTEQKIKEIQKFIDLSNKSVLDVGCATGELSLKLSEPVKEVVGIDLDQYMIAIASKKITNNTTFKTLNMLDIHKLERSFDVILCLGNTLSHLDSLEQVTNFFINCYNSLNDKAYLLFQIVNYTGILDSGIKKFPKKETEHLVFNRVYKLVDSKILFDMELMNKENGESLTSTINLLPLTKEQLELSLNSVGFGNIELYGSYQKEPYDRNSSGIVAVAMKK